MSQDDKAAKAAAHKAQGQEKAKKKKKKKGADDAYVAYKRETPPRLRAMYDDEIKSKLKDEFKFGSIMQVPRMVKITINIGLGRANQNPKLIESAVEELRALSGQAPVITKAKRDIAHFKLRRGQRIGCMVTLRGVRMWEFLDRFINVALPGTRDFRGVSEKAFDGRGNYSCGIKEQIIFPEIDYDKIGEIMGMNITIVTTANTDAEARALLTHLGMPFRGTTPTQAQGASA